MSTGKQDFISRLIGAKSKAEQKLQGFGARIAKNISQGQQDFENKKMPYYGTINPFK